MQRMILVSLGLSFAACSQPAAQTPTAQAQRALAIADEYQSWGRVDDELRWAPTLCRLPNPGMAYQSASTDASTHGQKLYSVFAKDHAGYPEGSTVGQVIVKESWKAELVDEAPSYFSEGHTELSQPSTDDHFHPYAKKGDKTYRASEPAGLYLMYRVEPGPESDEGWIYATINTDRQVTASGRVASCMGCHVEAPHGRLFGVPKSPDLR